MTKTIRTTALVLALMAGTAAHAAEPRIGKLVRYDAGEFTIITSRGASQARQFVEDLGKFRVTLEKTLGKHAVNNQFPTTIMIVSERDWTNYLQPRPGIAGYFQSAPFVNYMSMNGDANRDEATHIIFHEYTHYYLSSRFAGEYPPWFHEGLAELMGFASFTAIKGSAVLRIPMFRVDEARDGDWIPFERLIKVDRNSPEYQSHRLADSFYAQAWLTVQYGMVGNRQFGRQIFEYLDQINTLHPHEEAVRSSFGTDLAAVDRQLRAYAKTNMNSGTISLGEIPPVSLPAGQPVAENDAYAALIDLMLATHAAPGRIRPLMDALARREPDTARTAILRARLATTEEDDAAFTAAVNKAEAALPPGDWRTRRDLAGVLLRDATEGRPLSPRSSADEERNLKRACKLFGEAIAHNNQDVFALWGFGTAATRLGEHLDVAEDALVAAYKLAPASAQIAVSLANINARQNKPDAMIPYLQDTIRYATDLSMRRWAAETLVEMRKWIAERDAVKAQNEAIEARNRARREAYEKQVADYEKRYGKRKKKK